MAVKTQAKPRYDMYVISLKIWHLHIQSYMLQILPSIYLLHASRIKNINYCKIFKSTCSICYNSTCSLLLEFLLTFFHEAHTQSLTSVRELDTTYGSIGVSINMIHFTLLSTVPTHFIITWHTFILHILMMLTNSF